MARAWTEQIKSAVEPMTTLLRLAQDPYELIAEETRRHGDLFEMRLPGMPPVYVCSDPEDVRQLVTRSYEQALRFAPIVELFLDPLSLTRIDDEPHRLRRKMLSPPFNAEHVRAFGPTMLAVTDQVLAHLPVGRTLPLLEPIRDITMRVIIRCLFGVAEGPRFEELRGLVTSYMDLAFSPEMLALGAASTLSTAYTTIIRLSRRAQARPVDAPFEPSRLPLLRIADRLGRIRAILSAEIDRRLAEGAPGDDVLSRILQARFEDGRPMEREDLLAQLHMLVIGGYETTSTSLCWAAHCLMRHPEAVARLRAEVAEVMGDGFDPARVRDLNYLGAAIGESMRLFPIGIGLLRQLRQPMQIAGRELPADTVVMANLYLTQRHPALWSEPEQFRPERMLDRRPSGYLHFPFGAGVWRCIGASFAEHEMRIVLARLFTRFDLRPDPDVAVRPVHRGLTVKPTRGLPVIAAPVGRAAN